MQPRKIVIGVIAFLFSCTPLQKTPRPQPTSSVTTANNATEQIYLATNEQRKSRKIEILSKDQRLLSAAQAYAALMAKEDKLSHSVNGQQLASRVERQHYPWKALGENIAENTSLQGKEVVIQQWMHSTGHRENILSKEFAQIGIGIAGPSKTGKYYYCQIFARSK